MGEPDTGKQPPCIMVVDDDESILELIARLLEPEGYRIITASNAQSALASFEKQQPDLLILDVMMPELNGLQILNRVRQYSNVPVIMLTAREEDTIIKSAIIAGADDYVKKPFGLSELRFRIRAKLERVGDEKHQ